MAKEKAEDVVFTVREIEERVRRGRCQRKIAFYTGE